MDRHRRSRLHRGKRRMREGAMQLGREQEMLVRIPGDFRPQLCNFRLDVAVEGSVDLDHVKTSRENLQRMLFASGHTGWVENALPVFVGPTGRTHTNLT